jgi:hypothetical protein
MVVVLLGGAARRCLGLYRWCWVDWAYGDGLLLPGCGGEVELRGRLLSNLAAEIMSLPLMAGLFASPLVLAACDAAARPGLAAVVAAGAAAALLFCVCVLPPGH